jgi:hypothetical protein
MILGRTPDGRAWELLMHEGGVIVLMDRATVAQARIRRRGEVLRIDFCVGSFELPTALATHLVGKAFGHPSLRARQAVLVCLPGADVAVRDQVLSRLDGVRTRVAGRARLIEGTIRGDSVALSLAPVHRPT